MHYNEIKSQEHRIYHSTFQSLPKEHRILCRKSKIKNKEEMFFSSHFLFLCH